MAETETINPSQIEWKSVSFDGLIMAAGEVIPGEFPRVMVERFRSIDGGGYECTETQEMTMFTASVNEEEQVVVFGWNDKRREDYRRIIKFSEEDQFAVQEEGDRKAVVVKHESKGRPGEVRLWRFSAVE